MAGNPNMKDGAPSVNPGGRSRADRSAARILARFIQDQTRNGLELAEFALAIRRFNPDGPLAATDRAIHGLAEVTLEDRKWAMQWLTDRGFGKAIQPIDLAADGEAVPAILMPATLTDEELDAAEKALDAAAGGSGDG